MESTINNNNKKKVPRVVYAVTLPLQRGHAHLAHEDVFDGRVTHSEKASIEVGCVPLVGILDREDKGHVAVELVGRQASRIQLIFHQLELVDSGVLQKEIE